MNATWTSADEPQLAPITAGGWLRVARRGGLLGLLITLCLLVLLLLRLIERPIWGARRPLTPFITQFVCRSAFVILGIRFRASGRLMSGPGAVVANHSSWLDIFALNARGRIYFVSKSEVAGWPGIGWLARATGTVFINRAAREARSQKDIFESRLNAGHKLLFFPEGTSTDGLRVLPFKSTLFAAFFTRDLKPRAAVQPVTVNYIAPRGEDPRFYGWWGDMDLGPHLLQTLAAKRQGEVEVVYHTPLKISDFPDRKALAKACESAVRSGLRTTS